MLALGSDTRNPRGSVSSPIKWDLLPSSSASWGGANELRKCDSVGKLRKKPNIKSQETCCYKSHEAWSHFLLMSSLFQCGYVKGNDPILHYFIRGFVLLLPLAKNFVRETNL